MLDWVAISFPGEPGSCSDGLGHDQYIFNPIFLLMGGPMFHPYYLVGPNYSGGNEDNDDLLPKVPCMAAHSVPLTLYQATAYPCLRWRLLDIPWQVWASLLWGHYSFLLGPGALKILFVLSKYLFP